MSIQGLGGIYGQPGIIPGTRQLDGGREVESEGSRSTEENTHEAASLLGASHELTAKAPPGTDPNLWSVLTAEERSFFARAQTMGPLTYDRGAGNSPESTMQRGARIDVRV
jgi:hypothetical protein